METQGLNSFGHRIGETFNVGPISIKLTPAYHTWQNEYPGYTHEFKVEDYCGFLMKTPDGLIWAPGDSRFLFGENWGKGKDFYQPEFLLWERSQEGETDKKYIT